MLRATDNPAPPVLPPRAINPPAATTHTYPNLSDALRQLGCTRMECGATAVSAQGTIAGNQCFYLALAAGVAAPHEHHHRVAAELRERIESAVRAARPNWAAADFLGQEIGAFADFLIWGLQAAPRLRGRAVAVYNEQDGTCEIFRSPHHANRNSPVIALGYSAPGAGQLGHYTWIRFDPPNPTLGHVLTTHRRRGGRDSRVPTLVTDAVG